MVLELTETTGDKIYLNVDKIVYFKSWDQFTLVATEPRDFYVTETVQYIHDLLSPKVFIPASSGYSPDDCL